MIGIVELFPFRFFYDNENLMESAFKGISSIGDYFWSTFFVWFLQLS